MVSRSLVPAARGAEHLRLPAAAPAPVLEPEPPGLIARACVGCEVTWYGSEDDECWCCGTTGLDGPLRVLVAL